MKKMNFTCRACVEGERWEKEAREWEKKVMEGANREGWKKEQELGEWREEIERIMGGQEKSTGV